MNQEEIKDGAKVKLKRLNIQLMPLIHYEVKLHAQKLNTTLRRFVMQAIVEKIRRDRDLG